MASELRHYEQFFNLHGAVTLNGIGPSALLFAGADKFAPVNYAAADLLQSQLRNATPDVGSAHSLFPASG